MNSIERRKHARYRCEVFIQVEVRPIGEPVSYPGTLADICLGGCYISTISPLPPGVAVLLCLKAQDQEITIAGKTVTCLPGSGMGIEFTELTENTRVRNFIDLMENGMENGLTRAAKAAI